MELWNIGLKIMVLRVIEWVISAFSLPLFGKEGKGRFYKS